MPCLSATFDPALGPLVNLGVAMPASLSQFAIQPAASAGSAAAAPIIHCMALVDTGASRTCISAQIARAAGLPLLGKVPMASASQVVPANLYLADIALPFGDPTSGAPISSYVAEAIQVMEFQSNNPHFQALLGRDIICSGLFSIGFDRRLVFAI